jgi:hypothetical protein
MIYAVIAQKYDGVDTKQVWYEVVRLTSSMDIGIMRTRNEESRISWDLIVMPEQIEYIVDFFRRKYGHGGPYLVTPQSNCLLLN